LLKLHIEIHLQLVQVLHLLEELLLSHRLPNRKTKLGHGWLSHVHTWHHLILRLNKLVIDPTFANLNLSRPILLLRSWRIWALRLSVWCQRLRGLRYGGLSVIRYVNLGGRHIFLNYLIVRIIWFKNNIVGGSSKQFLRVLFGFLPFHTDLFDLDLLLIRIGSNITDNRFDL
jgi:hypothetical protein